MQSIQSSQLPQHLSYRPDIDGMRAVAVIFVIIFHAFPSILPAGFIGVDVFFVISGFLITSIILKDLREGEFSFAHFYVRRIRRIFPALFLVLLTTAVLGWVFLFPSEFKQLGKHLLGGATFVSNFVLWNEAGYFDAGAESKPLLHLWSLGIEEQFYIFFPLLLVFLYRRNKRILLALSVLACLSFLINVAAINRAPVAVFYAPISRAWELLAGGILATATGGMRQIQRIIFPKSSSNSNTYSVIGVIAIAFSLAFLSKEKAFPGWWAALPVLGAVMLIAAGPQAWVNQKILGSRILVSIGLISYPLYLWHWPLLSFLSIVSKGTPTFFAKFLTLLATFLLALLTYLLLEKKIRAQALRYITSPVLSLSIFVLGFAGLMIFTVSSQTRLGQQSQLASIYNAVNDWNFPGVGIPIKGAKQEKALFIGDSFLQHYYGRMKMLVESSETAYTVVYAGVGGCPPIPGVSRVADPGGCSLLNSSSFSEARQPDVKKVIFGSAWHYFYPIAESSKLLPIAKFEHDAMVYIDGDVKRRGITPDSAEFAIVFAGFEALVSELLSLGKEVYIVLPSPISDEFEPRLMINRLSAQAKVSAGISQATYKDSFAPIITVLTQISKRTGAKLLDPTIDLCSNGFCSAFYEQSPIYNDVGHIRPYFARDHISIFDNVILR